MISASGGSGLDWTIGQVFKKGNAPTAVWATDAIGVEVLNRWRDGSVRFALISGRSNLTGNTPKTISVVSASSDASATVDPASIGTASASISYGSYGTVSWGASDWSSPFITHSTKGVFTGIYRKPFAGDNHLVAWLEVRAYNNGAVEVVPWIENGYLRVAAPGERSGVASFSLGGTQRFSGSITLYNHTRTFLGSGTTFSHWLGTDPRISPRHDVAYMKATRTVPNYFGSTSSASPLWGRVATSLTPLAQHDFPDTMGAGGYDKSIGLLPEWEVAYLTGNADIRAWRAVQINAYAAGRYGLIFRDETTNRPLRFSQHPNTILGDNSNANHYQTGNRGTPVPAGSGGRPPIFAPSHHPGLGYLAYLITGRFYFIEQMQFTATAIFLEDYDNTRGFSQAVIRSDNGFSQTRGAAWGLRTLACAAAMTADSDVLKSEFAGGVQNNISWYHGRYVAQTHNNLGVVRDALDNENDPGWQLSPWMEDFFSATWSFLVQQEIHAVAFDARALEFEAWKHKCSVGRLEAGDSGQYCWRRAPQYRLTVSPSADPDWATGAGPWHPNWGAVYQASGLPNDCSSSNLLVGSGAGNPQPTGFPILYWANFHPAIAYAVEAGVPGAQAAYSRMTGASNYSAGAAGFDDTPVWGIKPR